MFASKPNPESPTRFAWGEVRGGNGTIPAHVELPGLRGGLYSRPCGGATGGDIHYLSVCGSGLLNKETGSCEDVARRLLAALHGLAASRELAHDDVTFLLAEFLEGPPGPALWHVFKHRVLRQARL
jgi:hypothetical protein